MHTDIFYLDQHQLKEILSHKHRWHKIRQEEANLKFINTYVNKV